MFALHVADGSEIITRHVGGPSLTFYVGNGRERYGSCTGRLHPARLAEGYLPIVQTSYVDANGVKYRQESFVGRAYGARSVVSFVKLDVDARHGAVGRDRSPRAVEAARALGAGPARVQGRDPADRQRRRRVRRRRRSVPGRARGRSDHLRRMAQRPLRGEDASRRRNRPTTPRGTTVVNYWTTRLTSGMQFDVPEPAVSNAALGVLAQVLAFGWRYSVGNPYEELSFAESLDSAEVAAEYGFPNVAKVDSAGLARPAREEAEALHRLPGRASPLDRGSLLPPDPRPVVHPARDAGAHRLVRQIRSSQIRRRAGARPPSSRAAVLRPPLRRRQRQRCDRSLAGTARDRPRVERHRPSRHRRAGARPRAQHRIGARAGLPQVE